MRASLIIIVVNNLLGISISVFVILRCVDSGIVCNNVTAAQISGYRFPAPVLAAAKYIELLLLCILLQSLRYIEARDRYF